MAKVNYRTCDICNRNISTSRGLDGNRLRISLFRRIDICSHCMDIIARFNKELKDEVSLCSQAAENSRKYDNVDAQFAYLEGFEFAINSVLIKNRVKKGDIR